jgi:hypothetical protein
MACFIIVLWLLFAWFLLVRPLKTGNAVDYRKYGRTTAVLRSDEPSRFWFIYWWGALLLSGMLALGLYCLTDRLRELGNHDPQPKKGFRQQALPASASAFTREPVSHAQALSMIWSCLCHT